MGWRKATSFSCVVAFAIRSVTLQLDGNQTDGFTLKGGLYKVTTSAKLQQEVCEMLVVLQLIVYGVMNIAAHSGSKTPYSAQCYEHSSTQWQ
jgi:hypothetical protein